MEKEKKANTVWLYSVVLVSIAILVIVIAAFANMRILPVGDFDGPERAFNYTAQQNIAALIEMNEVYQAEVRALQAEIDRLQERIDGYRETLIDAGLYTVLEDEEDEE